MKSLIIFTTIIYLAYSSAGIVRSAKEIEEYRNFLKKSVNGKPQGPISSELDDLQPAWLMSGKFEGDILLSDEQINFLVDEYSGIKNGLLDKTKLWPNRVVPYKIETNDFDSPQINAIELAISDIVNSSCLTFRLSTPEDKDYVLIEGKPGGCYSEVGLMGTGAQLLNLEANTPGNGCFRHGSIVHEFLHAIGFYHMQSTYNRDDYVEIVWDKIIPGLEHNFEKYTMDEVSNFETIYDYGSVMHYPEVAFSIDGSKTIIPTQPTDEELGQKIGMSERDIIKLNRLYECSGY